MKNNNVILWKLVIICFISIFAFGKVSSQCVNQITRITGNTTINGVNVTVTSTGSVDSILYCNNEPYEIGYTYGIGAANGSYTFSFSPAVSGVTLNFAGLTNSPPDIETVSLYVNGSHYAIPSIGSPTGCEQLAALTLNGDITGCAGCNLSGWNGTSILGPIASLKVSDIVSPNNGTGGTIFSLFICDPTNSIFDFTSKYQLNMYPNPADDKLTIEGKIILNSEIEITDILGRKVNTDIIIQFNYAIINCSELTKGIYFIKIKNDSVSYTEKFVKQ